MKHIVPASALILGAGLLLPAFLAAAPDSNQDLKVLNQQIVQTRRDEEQARRHQGSVLQEIDDLNRWHAALNGELQELGAEINEAEARLAEQEEAAGGLNRALNDLQQQFGRRLRLRYCQAPGKWLDFLAGDAELREKLNGLIYVRRVLRADVGSGRRTPDFWPRSESAAGNLRKEGRFFLILRSVKP